MNSTAEKSVAPHPMEQRVEHLASEVAKIMRSLENAEKTMHVQSDELTDLRKKHHGLEEDMERHLKRLESDVAQLKGDVGTLQGGVTTLKTDVGTLKTDVGTLQGGVTTFKTDVGTLKGDVTTLKADVGTLQGDVTKLKDPKAAAVKEANARLSAYTGKKDAEIKAVMDTDKDKPEMLVEIARLLAAGKYEKEFNSMVKHASDGALLANLAIIASKSDKK